MSPEKLPFFCKNVYTAMKIRLKFLVRVLPVRGIYYELL